MAKRNVNLVSAAASGADDWVDEEEANELLARFEEWRFHHPARLPKDPCTATMHTRLKKAGSVARAASGAVVFAVYEEVVVVPFSQKVAQGEEIEKL